MLMNNELDKLLAKAYSDDYLKIIQDGFRKERFTTFRLNSLKAHQEEVLEEFKEYGFELENVSWYKDAFIIQKEGQKDIRTLNCYQNGSIYLQSLSSMLPVLVLDPKEKETILDMTAAPGSKTTQIAMETNNKALITAVEKNKIRQDRLQYNLNKQGVTCVTLIKSDAKNLDDYFSFNKVLLDAPCSGSGTISLSTKDYSMFKQNSLLKLQKEQKELLLKALKVLQKGGTLVYSTCSILPQENEEVLDYVKKIIDFDLIPISRFEDIPLLPTKYPETLCVAPNAYFEGFFIAHLKKK